LRVIASRRESWRADRSAQRHDLEPEGIDLAGKNFDVLRFTTEYEPEALKPG
jgi:hypothetical protein